MRKLIATVFRKEMKDHLRDRRSVTSAFAGPLIGPIIFTVMFTMMASWFREGKPLEVSIIGREHAPSLVAFLQPPVELLRDGIARVPADEVPLAGRLAQQRHGV